MYSTEIHKRTPSVTVVNNRKLTIRDIQYRRRPDVPQTTEELITRHQYNHLGFLAQSTDPRLYERQQTDRTSKPNLTILTSLTGKTQHTDSVDAGITINLQDIADRPVLTVSAVGTQYALTQTRQYEESTLPGRLLSITESTADNKTKITERLVWADGTKNNKAYNLAGLCVRHYDTAGVNRTDSVALNGTLLSVTRQLLPDDIPADWEGDNVSAWDAQLVSTRYTTQTIADATGAVLTTIDASGNQQRVAYDVAGLLKSSWLALKGKQEQIIVKSLTYSAAGQKLREEHGNGVVTTYSYEPQTQRLIGIKTERPVGHAAGAKVLQDLRYEYDPVGNIVKIINDAEATRFWRNQKVVPENTYTYDSLYQLVSATGREMANLPQQSSTLPSAMIPLPSDDSTFTAYTRTYAYDTGGNLTQIRHSAPATGNNYTTRITVSNRSNRAVLSSLTEDATKVDALFTAGGHQNQLQPGQNLLWTPRGELLKVALVTREGQPSDNEIYRYGADSQRVIKTTTQLTGGNIQTQNTLYLPGLELRTTKNGETEKEKLHVITVGEAGRSQVRVLHWENGKPSEININDQVRYNYDNLIGSSGLEVDGSGNVISQEEYYPYGGTAVWTARNQTEANYKTLRYSGKERDVTGLYYYGYRYYQSWAGRWLSADPAGTVDGLNLFRMVSNNPISFFDTDGREKKSAEEVFDEYKAEHLPEDREFPFRMMAGITDNKLSFSSQQAPQKSMEKIQDMKFTLRHYTSTKESKPPFDELSTNMDLVKKGVKTLKRSSGSNTNDDDWNRLGNTAFTFYLLAIDGEVSDRKFLSNTTHYTEYDLSDTKEINKLFGEGTEFFASPDLLHHKDLSVVKAVKGKLTDLKSLLIAVSGISSVQLTSLKSNPKELLKKIDEKFGNSLEIKIPGNVKVKKWNSKK
ncbi:insecticidal toxin, SepC/Tcc class [Xenorhabdus vietnamensis]|uniref:Insecticidal toxin, SepC/Tcc class n=1 Tax=Xenorhabdus vietnamensis TaxID=351656 RepID=A0A1Y2SAM1_9GAMM|nr:RHS repeat domain-containing protein [Xenorhabdus vietnamensis]OTA14567.1 insecticidal toxin, SepC/Tcc class [Xenorhabdus vietnamensis]